MQEHDYENAFMMGEAIDLANEVIAELKNHSDLQEEIEIVKRREEHFSTVLRVEEQKNLNLAKANMVLEKRLKDRERRLDSIMGLANDCNYED
jgi:hypothetical protein